VTIDINVHAQNRLVQHDASIRHLACNASASNTNRVRGSNEKHKGKKSEKIRRKIEKKERKKDEEIKRKNERNTEVTPDL
jgi:hypothetical protein